MSSLGKLTYYLGNQVHQHEEEIMLKQDRYAHNILEETRMGACNPSHVPMDLNVNLSKSPKYRSIEEKEYRRSIGCLRYFVSYSSGFVLQCWGVE